MIKLLGLLVKVLLEYRTYFGYVKYNYLAYRYLKDHGVDVRLDFNPDTEHMKIVIIDGKIVYIGSHNWSEASLYYNHEVSIRIVSRDIAKEVEKYFNYLWNRAG